MRKSRGITNAWPVEDVKVTRVNWGKIPHLQHRSSTFFFFGKKIMSRQILCHRLLKYVWSLAKMVPRLKITCWPGMLA